MADIISKVFDENEDFRALIVLDDERTEELQLQEVLGASLEIFHHHMSSSTIQESPESSQGYCDICLDSKRTDEMFKLENCSHHSFCSDCIGLHVQSKIQQNIFPVTCPGLRCRAIIEPESCKTIIPENVFATWEEGLLSESRLLACENIYCPYRDCSGQLFYDRDQGTIELCPLCRRLFCAPCGVPWHIGFNCDKFQKEGKDRDDIKVEELAKKSKWMKCPQCKHVVQRADGCIHITCWCKFEYCYICGGTWSEEHWSCQIS